MFSIHHLVCVKDSTTKTLNHESVVIINKFLEFFYEDFIRVNLKWEMDFGCDLLLSKQYINVLSNTILAIKVIKLIFEIPIW